MGPSNVAVSRDAEFWARVFHHPEVWPSISLGFDLDLVGFVQDPSVTPFRSANGGYLFVRQDALGRVYELHAAFVPAGWGREASSTLKAALTRMFTWGAQVITSLEPIQNPHSRPPLSFGFRPAGDFALTSGLYLRSWVLTRAAWEQSPAKRRME